MPQITKMESYITIDGFNMSPYNNLHDTSKEN